MHLRNKIAKGKGGGGCLKCNVMFCVCMCVWPCVCVSCDVFGGSGSIGIASCDILARHCVTFLVSYAVM